MTQAQSPTIAADPRTNPLATAEGTRKGGTEMTSTTTAQTTQYYRFKPWNIGRFLIWSLVLQALILDAQGNRTAALASLRRALALAEPHGYVRIIINHGAPIAALLRAAHARWIAQAYIELLL